MNKLREVLRLHACSGLSNRKIARALKISASTVGYYVNAFKESGLTFGGCTAINDSDLFSKLVPYCQQLKSPRSTRTSLELMSIHQQLKQKGVTRELLWEEHCQQQENSYSYTEFCRQYRVFRQQQKPSMRQIHKAGDKAFVDYADPTIPIIDASTGVTRAAMIFVGVLGASNYTYAEATLTRSLPDWLGAHSRMYAFFGGVPTFTVPDNEKSAVTHACYYDPDLNPQYDALASHYDTVVLPTRPAKPQDKAKVEVAVQVVERWILARLRHHQFFSLAELNQAIAALLVDLNNKPFKKLPGTRASQFEAIDRPALKPLPAQPYVPALL
jgi:transposase